MADHPGDRADEPRLSAPPHEALPPHTVEPPAHEETDVDAGSLGKFLAAMAVSLVVVGALVYWQYRRFERLARANDPAPIPRADERQPPPPPYLQIHEVADMQALRQRQTALLERLEWIDPQARRVRIPIDRALEIVARDGLRRWPAPAENSPQQQRGTR